MNNDRVKHMPVPNPLSRRAFLRRMFVDTCALSLAACGFQTNLEQALAQTSTTNPIETITNRATPNALSVVATENNQPGSKDWELLHFQDDIEGFASATSINKGDAIDLYINTNAPHFNIAIYRSGYYGGTGGRFIKDIKQLTGVVQPEVVIDPITGLASCSNWSPTYHLETTTDWVSGIYIAKLMRYDTGGENHIYFVVRDDDRNADMLYQQSVTTYHAYNYYGGKSLYNFNSSPSTTIAEAERAVKISLKRPYTGLSDRGVNDRYTNVEYPLVSWLEQQGYDISYATNIDTHIAGKPGANNSLLKHKVFISAGHDEYWSQEMRDAVTTARDAGVHLCFFGSNTCYWRIRFEPDPVTHEPDAVIVCYKSTQSGPADPTGHATGSWRDPEGANQPEHSLIGIQYVGDHDTHFFPLRVTAEAARHPLYRHTGLDQLQPGSFVEIGRELIGWEWDAAVVNGRVPGLEIVAATPVFGELLTDAGRMYDLEQAEIHTTRYQASSGAMIFASGTNHWSWGLAIIEPDIRLQQMTYNMFADMAISPTTPASTLVLDHVESPNLIAPPVPLTVPQSSLPAISGIQVAPDGDFATFEWITDPATRGEIWLGTSASHINSTPYTREEQFSRIHQLKLMYLIPETSYYYRLVVTDEYGRTVLSPPQQFQTDRGSLMLQAKTQLKRLAASPSRTGIVVGGGVMLISGAGWLLRRITKTPRTQPIPTDTVPEEE
ncbi:MAG: N,N-dimethylformamidase beta subunit family domain-containing protein [Roseiflexaceae bacterium]